MELLSPRDDGRDEEDINKYTEIIRMQANQLQEHQDRIHGLYEEVIFFLFLFFFFLIFGFLFFFSFFFFHLFFYHFLLSSIDPYPRR